MKIAIISNEFPPLITAGAIQVRDLAREFGAEGHDVTVITSTYGLKDLFLAEQYREYKVLRFPGLQTKGVGYFRRTINEILTPLKMLRNMKKTSIDNTKWDGVVWYSPTIFLGPVARYLKQQSRCRGYLIVRDIFPDWAVDIGLIGRGFPYKILKLFEKFQYSVADIIGVQSKGNLTYFSKYGSENGTKVEVLNNWLSHTASLPCSIVINDTCLAGRKVLVYAGNMGVAQGIDILFDLVVNFKERQDVGFVFVGRGSEMERLRRDAKLKDLENVLFFDQIDPDEIPSLYEQCYAGMLSLDVRHKTHNIPGKFLSYMSAGLPVLASVNPGNDLISLINASSTGRVVDDACIVSFTDAASELIDLIGTDGAEISKNCLYLSHDLFGPEVAVKQILSSFSAQA